MECTRHLEYIMNILISNDATVIELSLHALQHLLNYEVD
jgi:hypothetical protein